MKSSGYHGAAASTKGQGHVVIFLEGRVAKDFKQEKNCFLPPERGC